MMAAKGVAPVALGALASVLAAGAVHAGTFRAGAGLDYTSGEYGGTETINQTYVPVSAAYRGERWGMRVTVPYVSVDGPGTIIDSVGEFIAGPDESRGGLGDVILGATLYDVIRNDDSHFYLDLGAKVKLGTASESDGLGMGENDYSLQVDVLKYDYRPSALRGGDALSEATAYVSFTRSRSFSFQPYLVTGFCDSSPDWGAGFSIGWRPGTR